MQQQKVLASDGSPNDFFGNAVAIFDKTAVVGASHKKVRMNAGQGVAYVYSFDGTSWGQNQELSSPDGGSNDDFGYSMALTNNTLLVGARQNVSGVDQLRGAA